MLGLSREERQLLREITDLRKAIEDLTARKEAVKREVELSDQIVRLKTQVSDLEIQKGKKQEEHDKQERELKHMIGLEKKRQEFEIEQSKRETTVTVREENLSADKTRFEEQMKFQTDRLTQEVGYLKEMIVSVLDRLPTVNVEAKR